MRLQLISLDVLGNEDDGFEVNNSFATGYFIDESEKMTDDEILRNLYDYSYLTYHGLTIAEINWFDESNGEIVCKETGEYLFNLIGE